MATSIRAVEKAIGFTPTEEIIRLRKIMSLSQIASSHIVHLYVLALPDYYGLPIITGMQKEIERLLRIKDVLNRLTAVFGGRALHPVAMVVGGFTSLPSKESIGGVIEGLESIKGDIRETLTMIAGLEYPELEADAEIVALSGKDGYKINKGTITSDKGLNLSEDDYDSAFEESELSYSNAKRTIVKGRGALFVGALSRLNLNLQHMHPEAIKAAQEVGFTPPVTNPYYNNVAQAIETIHCLYECLELLHAIEGKDHYIKPVIREGTGTAVTEAPRGLLCHQYTLNRRGVVEKANIITPTAHNFLSLENNLKNLITRNIDMPEKDLTLRCEMLVRAYDPCFSCSVH
jgi:sulfhydrogenase subunit alpha